MSQYEKKDEWKLMFALESLDHMDPFALQTKVHEDVAQVRRTRIAKLWAPVGVFLVRRYVGMQRGLPSRFVWSARRP